MPLGRLLRLASPLRAARRCVSTFASPTHSCGALRASDAGQRVVLAGWLLPARRRAGAELAFRVLRDAEGDTQLLLRGAVEGEELMKESAQSVLCVQGTVRARGEGRENANMATGAVDLEVESYTLLNAAGELPFDPSVSHERGLPAREELRLPHRFLDLRRPSLTHNLQLRSRVTHAARCFLHDAGFAEVDTPVLLRSTPEGAREFLVPTRVGAEEAPAFYALQQSPQQPKQLLIASGATQRYFQLARCFRDEDGRKDRQPEFTQLDIEMAFVQGAPRGETKDKWRMGGEEVRTLVEGVVRRMWAVGRGEELPQRFDVLPYQEAMARVSEISNKTLRIALTRRLQYGSDKPDLRFGLEIRPISHALHPAGAASSSAAPSSVVEVLHYTPGAGPEGQLNKKTLQRLLGGEGGEKVEVEVFKATSDLSELLLSKSRHVREYLAEQRLAADEVPREQLAEALRAATAAGSLSASAPSPTDEASSASLVFVARRAARADGGSTLLGDVRLRLAQELEQRGLLVLSPRPHFVWITEFPLFTRADDDKAHLARGRWSSTHHPFTAPMAEDVRLLGSREEPASDEQLAQIRGQHYDLVLNGQEVGGGSVRIHNADMQEHVMRNVLQLTDEEVGRFGHLLHALRCGAPPHAGLAIGMDRFMAIICGAWSIRDVIAFPKSAGGSDLLFRSPAAAGASAGEESEVLAQYGLRRT